MLAHLSYLPGPEAADRVALAGADGVASLAPFTLTLTDLGGAMLDAPSSVPPRRELVPR